MNRQQIPEAAFLCPSGPCSTTHNSAPDMSPSRLRSSLPCRHFQRAMTIPELLMVVTIVAVLSVIGVRGYQHFINKAESVDSITKLKGMHAALLGYMAQNLTWPQEPDDDSAASEEVLWDWWKKELKPFGIHEVDWYSTAHLRRLNREIRNSGGKAVNIDEMKEAVSFPSIVPTSFPPGPTEPYRYENQPWISETGEYHGDEGIYTIMPGGSIHIMKTMEQMNAARGKTPPSGGKK